LTLAFDFMAECVLDRGVIAFDKVAFAVLNGQGRLACDFVSAYVIVGPTNRLRAQPSVVGHSPTDRLPKIAIFLCFTVGAML
jgi:hypothetical protein